MMMMLLPTQNRDVVISSDNAAWDSTRRNLAAERVTVITRSMQPNSKQLRWTSDASDSYTITEIEDNDDDKTGTSIP
jgi:hypothetical protein